MSMNFGMRTSFYDALGLGLTKNMCYPVISFFPQSCEICSINVWEHTEKNSGSASISVLVLWLEVPWIANLHLQKKCYFPCV